MLSCHVISEIMKRVSRVLHDVHAPWSTLKRDSDLTHTWESDRHVRSTSESVYTQTWALLCAEIQQRVGVGNSRDTRNSRWRWGQLLWHQNERVKMVRDGAGRPSNINWTSISLEQRSAVVAKRMRDFGKRSSTEKDGTPIFVELRK